VYGDLLVAELLIEEHLGQLGYGGVLGPPYVSDIERLSASTAATARRVAPRGEQKTQKAALISLPASSAKMHLPGRPQLDLRT
jgi:hypothetical protein